MTTDEELEQMLEFEVRQYNESADSIQEMVRQWHEIEHWMASGGGTPTILEYHAGFRNGGPQQEEPELKEDGACPAAATEQNAAVSRVTSATVRRSRVARSHYPNLGQGLI